MTRPTIVTICAAIALPLFVVLLSAIGIDFIFFLKSLIGFLAVVLQVFVGSSIYYRAKSVNNLYAGMPPWIWGTLAFALPFVGLLLFWMLHDSIHSKPDL